MKREYHRWHSPRLGIELGVVVYGHWGPPLVGFPTSAGDEWELEGQGMIGALADFIDSIFVGILCMNSFILAKPYSLLDVDDGHLLSHSTAKVHLNAPLLSVVLGDVLKALWVKPSAKFMINPVEHIQVELGCYAARVVIRRDENRRRFFQVNA